MPLVLGALGTDRVATALANDLFIAESDEAYNAEFGLTEGALVLGAPLLRLSVEYGRQTEQVLRQFALCDLVKLI